MTRLLKLIPALLCLFFCFPLVGQTSLADYNLKLLPISDMLPNSTVKRIFQDKTGFVWFATESGLCRYDGYKTETVKLADSSSFSYISNNIQCIAQDSLGRIWAGTKQGLMIVDSHCALIDLFGENPILQRRITSLLADGKYMWVGTDNGLYCYDLDRNVFRSYLNQQGSAYTIPKGSVSALLKAKDGKIWIAIWGQGLCWLDVKSSAFTRLPAIGSNNNPFSIYQDEAGVFWVSTWRDGLLRMSYDETNGKYDYKLFDIASLVPETGMRNIVYNVVEDRYRHLWLITPRGIVRMIDKENGVFEYISTQNIYPETSNFLHHVYRDNEGNLWIGATNDGVYFVSFNEQMFQYNILQDIKRQLGYTIVNDIQYINNAVWVGFTNGGVHLLDPRHNFRLLQKSNNISSITKILQIPFAGEIWSFGDNISKLTHSSSSLSALPFTLPMEGSKVLFNGNNTTDAVIDNKQRIWIASRFGVYLYPWGEKVKSFAPYFNDVIKLMVENDTTVWALSSGRGILKILEQGDHFSAKSYHVSNGKLFAREANTIFRMEDGTILIGTDNGLFIYNREQDLFESVNAKYELIEKNILNIQQDVDGNLWLTSNNKIIKIDVEKKTSTAFTSNDNIRVATFRPNSSLVLDDSLMIFGGSEGLCYFKPVEENHIATHHHVAITDIQIFNKSIFGADSGLCEYRNDSLFVTYKQNNIGLEFSSLDFSAQGNNKYAYRLKGVDADWIYVDGKRRYVNYNNLKAGRYLFEVKASGSNGAWTQDASCLYIEVIPAPYLTTQAYCVYAILLILLLGTALYLVSNRIKWRNRLMISNIEKLKSEELIQTKLRYFTNVSHELLTPLTIISCLADEIGLLQPNVSGEYQVMKANINRLKRLLQQVLDFRKTESANMKLKVGYADIVQVVKEICRLNFAPLIRDKQIAFHIHSTQEEVPGWFDQDKIDKILFNLLSNAFKYTPKGGTIEVHVDSFLQNDIQWITLSVRDTGRGIDKKLLPHIFVRFVSETHDKKIESNGIGLSLAKDLIELHLGTIQVESELGKGSLFTVRFPISESVYAEELKFERCEEIIDNKVEESSLPVEKETNEKEKQPILLVDDNPDLLNALSRFFSIRFKVYTATTGVEAIACLRENEINLIVSDVMMPEMDGIELCIEVKKNIETSHIPIILLTARTQVQDRIACYKADANAYIAKPFDLSLLEARIDNLLNMRVEKNNQYKKELHINLQDLDYNSLDQEYLNKAIETVELHLGDFDFTPEILIKEMNTTKSTLYRKLKSLTGLSTSEFIKNIRLKHACEMLQKDAGNISDIAYNIGFNDPKYFSTCFRAEFGVSPREYVKTLKKEVEISC